jgi:hypothetical protein
MSGPAFDEPAPHPCKNHPMRESVEPIAHRRCAECKQYAIDGYADYMIKRDKDWQNTYDPRNDSTPDGRNIRTAEANHRMLTNIARDRSEPK